MTDLPSELYYIIAGFVDDIPTFISLSILYDSNFKTTNSGWR